MKRYQSQLSFILLLSLVLLFCCSKSTEEKPENVLVSADGNPINFVVQGQGEPSLVFVHGFAGSHEGWDDQMSYFSKKYKVVAMDLPGFGESGNNRENWTMGAFGEDVVSVIEHLNLEGVILVGHSMGGVVILEAAKRIPGKIIGLVPCDMFHNVEESWTDEQIEQFISRALDFYFNPTEEMLRAAFKKDIDPIEIEKKINSYKSASKIGWKEIGREFATWRWRPNNLIGLLKEIQTPMICINSDRQATEVEIARKYVPLFDAKIMEGVGHSVMVEDPEEFNRLLEEVIQEFISPAD